MTCKEQDMMDKISHGHGISKITKKEEVGGGRFKAMFL